jgi:hypothetical protein
MPDRDEPLEVREVRDLLESRQDIVRRLAPVAQELREAEHNLVLAIRAAQRRNLIEYREGLSARHDYVAAICFIRENWHAVEAEVLDRLDFRALSQARAQK